MLRRTGSVVAAFLAFASSFAPGVPVCDYVGKPDMAVREVIAFARTQAGTFSLWEGLAATVRHMLDQQRKGVA